MQQSAGEEQPLLRVPEQNKNEINARTDQPWYRRPSVFWLLPLFTLATTAFGATIVPKIEIILSIICRQHFASHAILPSPMDPIQDAEPRCQDAQVQALVSTFTKYGNLICGILTALISPRLGALSDRYGRTKMIAITTLGSLLGEIVFLIVAHRPDTLSANWILLGYVFDGLGGSFIAALALSYAYASDCTPHAKRNVVFGYYSGCLFAGIALGPLLAAFATELSQNIFMVFYIALACQSLFMFCMLFILPESLSQTRQLEARQRWAQSKSSFKARANVFAPLAVLWPQGNVLLRRNLAFLAAVDTITFGVAMASMTVIMIYTNYLFGWRTFETGIFVSVVNFSRAGVLLVLLPIISWIFRRRTAQGAAHGCDNFDLALIRVAILFDLSGFLGYIFVRNGNWFTACGVIASFGGIGSPTLRSALTKHVPPDQTGQVLGAMGLLDASARIFGPIIFNSIYSATVGIYDQAVFVSLAASFGIAFVCALCIRPHGG